MASWPTPSSDELAMESKRDKEATERLDYQYSKLIYTY